MNIKSFTSFCCLFAWVFNLTASFLYAQSQTGNIAQDSVLIIKKSKEFEITGTGSAENWNQTKWITLIQRNSNGASYQTQIKLLYSDSGIYCLFNNEDRKITSTLKGDFLDLFKEDVVEVFFWPDETIPVYFEYELSPMNYELPILVPNLKGGIMGWTPWHYEGDRKSRHATYINREKNMTNDVISWSAEFFIPFSLLRPLVKASPQKGTRWRANFYRIDYDSAISHWSWQLTRKNFHDYEKFGMIMFE